MILLIQLIWKNQIFKWKSIHKKVFLSCCNLCFIGNRIDTTWTLLGSVELKQCENETYHISKCEHEDDKYVIEKEWTPIIGKPYYCADTCHCPSHWVNELHQHIHSQIIFIIIDTDEKTLTLHPNEEIKMCFSFPPFDNPELSFKIT